MTIRAYIDLFMVLVLAGLMIGVVYYHGQVKLQQDKVAALQSSLDIAVSVNKQQQADIVQLQQLNDSNDKTITALDLQLDKLDKTYNNMKDNLTKLEIKNVQVNKYLNIDVPIELQRLLDRQAANNNTNENTNSVTAGRIIKHPSKSIQTDTKDGRLGKST